MSFIPILVLIALVTCCVAVFGNATLDGASQVSLLVASAVSVMIGELTKKLPWKDLEQEITNKVASCTPAIIILLLIGAIGGTWMVSGIVPTMIYYGVQIIRPEVFLISSSVLCAMVSLLIGSSWTTVATIGVALMGIGKAHGFDDGWIAGSIITGAYFGDKLSPLSDTTVLASSVSGTPLFTHIKYMMNTTVPAFIISLSIFFVAGLTVEVSHEGNALQFMEALGHSFVISPWLLAVPMLTGIMIARRWPSLVVLFLAVYGGYKVRQFRTREFIIHNRVDAISHAACTMAIDLQAKAIVVTSLSGLTVRMVSRFRAPITILGLATGERAWYKLALSWGVIPLLTEQFPSMDVLNYFALKEAKRVLNLDPGDTVVMTGGNTSGQSGNTNVIRIETV